MEKPPTRAAGVRWPPRAFLLSPAHCGGERARMICRDQAAFDLALRLRSDAGAPLGEVFSFLSGLYFRGKLAYVRAFAHHLSYARVITPSDGLRHIDDRVGPDDLARYAAVPVDQADARYRLPLDRDLRRLARRLPAESEVVLLGSIATRKYCDVLEPVFGNRLRVPADFVGRGDMSRGAMMLRAVKAGRELEYIGLDAVTRAARPRRATAPRSSAAR